MNNRIFIVLGGQDKRKTPRIKRLIYALSNLESLENTNIILTGYKQEVDEMKQELIYNKIPKEIIIEEINARETLGNLIFSYDIILQMINQKPNKKFEITLITEGFHIKRTKKLFLMIFKNLLKYNQNITFNFIGANTKGISSFYWKRKFLSIIERIKRKILQGGEIEEYSSRIKMLTTKYSIDYLAMDIILTDFDIFRVKTLQDIRNYMYNLYIYKDKFKPSSPILMKFSIYEKLLKLSKRQP